LTPVDALPEAFITFLTWWWGSTLLVNSYYPSRIRTLLPQLLPL